MHSLFVDIMFVCFYFFILEPKLGHFSSDLLWRQISGTTKVTGSSLNCITMKNNNLGRQNVNTAFLLKIN